MQEAKKAAEAKQKQQVNHPSPTHHSISISFTQAAAAKAAEEEKKRQALEAKKQLKLRSFT